MSGLFSFETYEDAKYWLLLIVAVLIVTILIILLIVLIKKIKKREIKKVIEEPPQSGLSKLKAIREPSKSILLLNKLVKNFFKNYLKIEREVTYEEIANKLESMKKTKMAKFCSEMSHALYSGEKITREEINVLIEKFQEISQHRFHLEKKKLQETKNKIEKQQEKEEIIKARIAMKKHLSKLKHLTPKVKTPEIIKEKKLSITKEQIKKPAQKVSNARKVKRIIDAWKKERNAFNKKLAKAKK